EAHKIPTKIFYSHNRDIYMGKFNLDHITAKEYNKTIKTILETGCP
ncbi:hypothetical protein KSS87_010448, partial [Heliosperma pusillum]